MAMRPLMPDLKCMDPENYRKYFRALCWSSLRKSDKRPPRKLGRKEKLRRLKSINVLAVCYAPKLLANPSQFAVYATVRKAILTRWRYVSGYNNDYSDDSDNDDYSPQVQSHKVPKITGIGLRAVFTLISQSRFTDSHFCEHALRALLDVLQGHPPEELAQEPPEIISSLQSMLVEIASGNGPSGRMELPSTLTAISSSCLMALSVARGEAELILSSVASLIMAVPAFSEQSVKIPYNLTTLQRSVQSVILGPPSRNQWLHYGVPHQSLATSFPVDLPPQVTAGSTDLVVRSLVSDGCFLYVYTSRGLLKIGSGYGSSIKQHVYLYKPDFFASDRHGWLGYCKNKLYVRIGRKKPEVYEVDKETFEVRMMVRLEPGSQSGSDQKSAVFTDGKRLGLVLLTNIDILTIKMYDVDTPNERPENGIHTVNSRKELNVHLLRRRTLALGKAPFEDGLSRRAMDLDAPIAMQFDDTDDDPLLGISAGQDFGLLTTRSGKVYYTGKGTSLGYKMTASHTGRWTLMKETLFNRHDPANPKKCRVIQVAVGHEGVHAILVLDNGTALFTGVARRGEDGDTNKHRRSPKPTRPRKILKAEGHYIVYAACNYGSTALVTRQGLLLMFGKDTQHCDSNGLVTGLRHERVIQIALGKAHAVALTNFGQVYTFGINNKGQCGREFGYSKERPYPPSKRPRMYRDDVQLCAVHTWFLDFCRVCTICKECTGFFNACHCVRQADRIPGERCGCGEGDMGCTVCGVCRRCAELYAPPPPERADSDDEANGRSDAVSDADGASCQYEGHSSGSDSDKESSIKLSCLPPARIAIPGGHRVVSVACGLHHTVLLVEGGEVLTFGSNQYGALGAGDVSVHHRLVRVRVPRVISVTAGSNHTAVLTREGEVYTFGAFQKGALGRPRIDEPRTDRGPIWFATPGRVPRIGPRYANKAVWITASGDQTFVQVSQTLIKTDTIFSATITANSNTIIILPNRPEHTFKCITINKIDGSCNSWTGPEQVDFVNTLACLDPLYDALWCYQPGMRLMKCYNILAFDSHKLQRCCFNDPDSYAPETDFDYPNYGTMRRLEDFKNLENFEFVCNSDQKHTENMALSNMSILNQELAIPSAHGCNVTRMHAALHLLGCLDSLTYAHDAKLATVECKRENSSSPILPAMEDYLTVNRFESHGGGWGYSGHSVEAIRFMCDNDILLGGFGLFGGRGDYAARIKLFDIGPEGGDQESDGDLLAETDEINYECPPRDRFPILFENPIPLAASRWYVAWACINGPSSDCGSSGQAMVINDEVGFHFKTSKKSNNGTDVNAGQIPCLLYNVISSDQSVPIRNLDFGEPIIVLSKNLSRKVTVHCFRSLINLLHWSWNIFKEIVLDTNGQIPINYHKLTTMKHQKRLVYVIRACIRLVKSYTNEIYPKNNRRRNSHDYMPFLDIIGEARNFIQGIMADPTPTCSMLTRKPGRLKSHRICYVQFALEMTNSILNEAHETVVSCFHAFFPNPALKWNYLCSLLYHVKDGVVPPSQIRALTSTCAAMCDSRSLCEVLQYIVPVTQNYLPNDRQRPESRAMKDIPSKSATVPRSSHSQKPPPIPPRTNRDNNKPQEGGEARSSHEEWHLLDVVPRLLDVVLNPIKQQMMTRQCGQPHDHGEIKQRDRLAEYCCKFTARLVGDLTYNASNEDMGSNTVRYLITPSRFMRVNQSRVWNTGNGTPDAICFSVDRTGIALVGACIYGGSGSYDYTMELLHDVRLKVPSDETNPSHCWVSVETVHGSFNGTDLQHDMVQVKFERPIPLKEELRYALRLCNQGARTASGDCGLPSVNGPDGTTFNFTSCSLSFNGTSLARGQIPCLIYQGSSKSLTGSESGDRLYSIYRGIALRVASSIMERGAELFSSLRNELTAEDLRRNAAVLQQSPVINTLLPYTLANLDELDDPLSAVQMLEMIHQLLPHVAAMNLLVPPVEDVSTNTTSHYYTWVESEHPYKQAIVSNMRVLFPPQVSWIVLEMDPRSLTAQQEDSLTIYAVAGAPKHKCHCTNEIRIADPPFRKVYKRLVQLTSETGEAEELEDANSDAPCTHYNCTYVSVTPRLSNVHDAWPKQALLVPGNEVIFSLETASDYLNEYNKPNNEESRFGFRCLCVGYEDAAFTSQKQGLTALEMELVYAGAACASRLLAPDVEIPPLQFSTIMDLQMTAAGVGGGETESEESDALLLARGLELSSPPSVHHVLDGLPLMRSASTERKFLSDFVAGAESTAGGRLACWLAPLPRVVPTNCEMRPPTVPVRPATKVTLPVIVKDQYGEIVTSPALKIEVVVQRLEDHRQSRATTSDRRGNVPDVPYNPIVRETMTFKAITMMKAYQNFSFEELRFSSGVWGGASVTASAMASGGRVPAERISVQPQPDGTYIAFWTPRAPGSYEFRCSLDNVSSKQELTIDVVESPSEEQASRTQSMVAPAVPTKLKSFAAPDSAGLRIRASPSLQSEEIGRVPPGANIAFVEEVVNKDGTWVRLSAESILAYANGAPIAWCMQYHRPYDRTLLQNIEPSPTEETEGTSGFGDALSTEPPSWNTNDEDDGAFGSGDLSLDERRFPFAIRNDTEEQQGDSSSSSPFMFGMEPSKRGRLARYESTSVPTPRRFPRRSNGNADDWWSPVRYRSSDNLRDVSSMPECELLDGEMSLGGRLAQATQTSPDADDTLPIPHFHIGPPRDSKEASRSGRERSRARFRRSSSPPPVPARAPLAAPRKFALSPAQAECLRAVFASMLRHEGIVPDAIACAAFLKFHPHLPKSGAPVVTRGVHDVAPHRPQRHSVEVSNAGSYLRINPSTLESLTRSGTEASASRARKADVDSAIKEDEPHSSHTDPVSSASSSSVVNVLPPALRALVALWDALCDSDQLAPATDKYRKDVEANENEEVRPSSGVRRKKDSKFWPTAKTPYSVRCELCGGATVAPPLAGHMKQAHPGCRAATSRGYDRAGAYRDSDPPSDAPSAACGQLAQDLIGVKIRATLSAYQLWYIYCEKCRERSLKATSTAKHKTVTIIEGPDRDDNMDAEIDHIVIRDNALFLLDLAPLNNSESLHMSPWSEVGGRSPPTPPGSVWQPAPPFQVLAALGAAPRAAAPPAEPARYHSLGRPPPPPIDPPSEESAGPSRVHRSVSMGQAGGRDLASAALLPLAKWEPDPIDSLPGAAGSSLLAQPSSALQKLVACGEWTNEGCTLSAFEPPTLDIDTLMRSPVMTFVLSRKDLHGYRQKMDAAVRVNTVRQYGFEALNWLLRSSTQPTCVHDVMWWFCNTLEKYSHIMPQPQTNEDDNKENAVNEVNPRILQTPSASAICPGGKAARGARAAFHSFLGSISALAPSLPTASAAGLQAVRCWALHYSQHDRAFLHRSQVFSVISKILSHGEDGAYEEGVMGALHESYHSYNNKQQNFVWTCPDVTGWCDVAVSSRQGMAGALTDGSTETFWESGDEDRNKAKWIQISYPGGSIEERPHVVCVHIDNTRDTVNKTLLISFLFSGGTSELFHMQDLEVDTKSATWLCYTLPRMPSTTVRVRCEMRGPEAAVRVRQVRVLSAPAPAPAAAASPPLHALVERDTLRVFRLLTSQVFGKLLEWEECGSEAGEAIAAEETVGDDSDLREHVVGILFAGHKLTSLQCQVMSHIVIAIGCEAARVRDDWETALLCAESAVRGDADDAPRAHHHQQDNYCFEMLSMLLALSGSVAGRAHLAQRTELLPDLLALLHTGSERVQRQVISLLRRIIIEISPQKMLAALNFGNDIEMRVTLLDHLVCFLGKAVTVQVKVKGAGGSTSSGSITMGSTVTPAPPATWFMRGETLKQHSHLVSKLLLDMAEDKMTPAWGAETRASLAQYVAAIAQTPDGDRQPARCLAAPTVWMALAALCVCEQTHIDLINSASEARKCKIEAAAAASTTAGATGGAVSRGSSGITEAYMSVAGAGPSRGSLSFENAAGPSTASCSAEMSDFSAVGPSRPTKRKPYRTITLAEVVVEKPPVKAPAVAAVTMAAADGAKAPSDASEGEAGAVAVRRMCVNHDDGSTCAVIDCRTCGPLCTECDRFLHLSRVSKSHQRQICKEEESAIRVDIHEGCGRAKLFWLLLLVDRRTLKALAEFRGLEGGVCEPAGPAARAPLAGVCRYCGVRGNSGLLAIGNICADHQCQEHGRESCTRVLSCGHGCGGVRGERACLPCLFGCGGGDALRQDADDMCMICFTDPLQAAPAIQLKCGHVFHLHCCKKVILNKWNGPRITFSFSQCPICKDDMSHWTLEELLAPIKRLKEEVRRKAMMRLEYEGLAACGSARGRALADPATYAMERYAYYVCHKCGKAYFGGLARCEAETNGVWEPSELVCGACSDVAGARTCPKHGADFLEYKCRYCCSVAVFFCFGTSHFCNACHDDFQRVTNIPRHMLPQCPAGPKAEQLPGSSDECPLHVQHPPTGEEFALGCGVCRHAHAF